jgi:hypothetical protein
MRNSLQAARCILGTRRRSKGEQASRALEEAAAIMAALAAHCVRRARERELKIEDLRRKYPGML